MKHVFIVSSQIKKRKRINFYDNIHAIYKNQEYVIRETTYSGHAKDIAKEMTSNNEYIRLYACGGDGTLHQIINGIQDFSKVEVAVIPLGTGNDFVKSFSPLTKKDFINLYNYQHDSTNSCNLLEVNGHYAINTASVGLDVKIAKNVEYFKFFSFLGSSVPYYLGLLYSMLHSLSSFYKIKINNQIVQDDFVFIVCGNGKYYGGGYCPVPDAKIDDNRMDICLIKKVTRRKILTLSHKYKTGRHVEYEDLVSIYQANSLEILSPSKQLTLNLDGELETVDSLYIRLANTNVKIVLPKIQ